MKKFLIAGLGNPGARYAKTRHNAGIDFIEELSKKWNLEYIILLKISLIWNSVKCEILVICQQKIEY